MAAPSHTTRSTPTGIAFKDGFPTKIAFSLNPAVKFWEKTVTPPSYDGGDAIDVTNMHNNQYRTFRPRSLIQLGEVSCTAAYDEAVFDEILSLINQEGSVTVTFPDGSQLSFYGYLRVFEPQENTEGEEPVANITIQVTNWDPANRTEEGPVLAAKAGT